MRTRKLRCGCSLSAWRKLAAVVSPAAAQTARAGKWEIDFHGGGASPTNPTAGTASLPAQGELFTTSPHRPPPWARRPSSRRESSWYFGDGAVCSIKLPEGWRQAAWPVSRTDHHARSCTCEAAGRAAARGEHRRARQPRADTTAQRRTERRLQPRAAPDHSGKQRRDRSDACEFHPAFNGLITFNPNRVLNSVTSTAALESGGGHQLFTSGALIINLRTTGDVIPYATVGASLISTIGKCQRDAAGNYQFLPGALRSTRPTS